MYKTTYTYICVHINAHIDKSLQDKNKAKIQRFPCVFSL